MTVDECGKICGCVFIRSDSDVNSCFMGAIPLIFFGEMEIVGCFLHIGTVSVKNDLFSLQ